MPALQLGSRPVYFWETLVFHLHPEAPVRARCSEHYSHAVVRGTATSSAYHGDSPWARLRTNDFSARSTFQYAGNCFHGTAGNHQRRPSSFSRSEDPARPKSLL